MNFVSDVWTTYEWLMIKKFFSIFRSKQVFSQTDKADILLQKENAFK